MQLYDQSRAVAMEALSVISEACEEEVSQQQCPFVSGIKTELRELPIISTSRWRYSFTYDLTALLFGVILSFPSSHGPWVNYEKV